MGVGKQNFGANVFIITVVLLSAGPVRASSTFIDSLRNAMLWLDFTRHQTFQPFGTEGLWRPILNFHAGNGDCSQPLLTREGRRACISGSTIFYTRNLSGAALVGTPVAPEGTQPLIALDAPDFNFANNADVEYYSGLPPETIDSEELKVRPLWKDEVYDHTRSPTAGVTLLQSF